MKNVNKFKPTVEIRNRPRHLNKKDNWHWVIGLSLDLGVIALAVIFSRLSQYFYLLTVLLIGSRQRAISSLLHEAVHMTLMNNKVLCRVIGKYLLAYPIFQNYDAYRHSHVQMHHCLERNVHRPGWRQ